MLRRFSNLKFVGYKKKFQKKKKFRSYLPTQIFLAMLPETDYFFFWALYE